MGVVRRQATGQVFLTNVVVSLCGLDPSEQTGYANDGRGGRSLDVEARLLPTPRATDGTKGGPNQRGSKGDPMLPSAVHRLLPTPVVNDMGEGKTPQKWDEMRARWKAKHGNGNGHGNSLAIEAQRLMPTPTSRDHKGSQIRRGPHRPSDTDTLSRALADVSDSAEVVDWGKYEAAIRRAEQAMGTPAPYPTTLSPRTGNPQLSAAFTEWLMMLPTGWVTGVEGISRAQVLKILGNGVVVPQAEHALRLMMNRIQANANV